MKLTKNALLLVTLSLAAFGQLPTPAAPRLVCIYLDLSSMSAAEQARAQESAVQFIQQQLTPSDRTSIMAYTSAVNVLSDFTADRDTLVSTVRAIVPAEPPAPAGNATEFNIFETDRKLAALETAAKMLANLPEKKVMVYISGSSTYAGVDNQAQMNAAINALMRANITLFPMDMRGQQ